MKRYYIFACMLCFYGICGNDSDDEIGLNIDAEIARNGNGLEHLPKSSLGESNAGVVVGGDSDSGVRDSVTSSLVKENEPVTGFGPSDE